VTGKTAAADGSPPLLRYAQAMALLRRANPPSSAARPPAPFFKGGYFDGTARLDKVAPFFKGGYFNGTARLDKVAPFFKGGYFDGTVRSDKVASFFKGGYFDGTVRSDKVSPFFKGGYFDGTVRLDKVVPFEKGGGCGASAPHGGFASCWNVSERLFARTTHAVSATC
jgi:putative component of membrane protein insertase Oxa1/YidC/SpoIIIJ protein YidD